jgi:hypothetical protein
LKGYRNPDEGRRRACTGPAAFIYASLLARKARALLASTNLVEAPNWISIHRKQ